MTNARTRNTPRLTGAKARVWFETNNVFHFKNRETGVHSRLEALAVDDGGARLVVLLLGDPHLLEGGQGGQDGATNPDGVSEHNESNG